MIKAADNLIFYNFEDQKNYPIIEFEKARWKK